jgi:hypothetical protein
VGDQAERFKAAFCKVGGKAGSSTLRGSMGCSELKYSLNENTQEEKLRSDTISRRPGKGPRSGIWSQELRF